MAGQPGWEEVLRRSPEAADLAAPRPRTLSGQLTQLGQVTNADQLRARFWTQLARGGGDVCWLWTGSTGNSGYGLF